MVMMTIKSAETGFEPAILRCRFTIKWNRDFENLWKEGEGVAVLLIVKLGTILSLGIEKVISLDWKDSKGTRSRFMKAEAKVA